MITILTALLALSVGLVLGWLARGRVFGPDPAGYAVVFPGLAQASQAWVPGGRIWYVTGRRFLRMTSHEVNLALAARLDNRRASPPPPPKDPDRIPPSGGRWKGA